MQKFQEAVLERLGVMQLDEDQKSVNLIMERLINIERIHEIIRNTDLKADLKTMVIQVKKMVTGEKVFKEADKKIEEEIKKENKKEQEAGSKVETPISAKAFSSKIKSR